MKPLCAAEILFDENAGVRTQFRKQMQRLVEWAAFNQRCLEDVDGITTDQLEKLKVYFKNWREIFILDCNTFGLEVGATRTSMNAHIFMELSRTLFLMYVLRLREEEEIAVEKKAHTPGSMISHTLPPSWGGGEDTPVLQYTQAQVVHAILQCSQQLNMMRVDSISSFIKDVRLLWLRTSVFFCEDGLDDTILDAPGMSNVEEKRVNTDFAMFCTIYFEQILRRIYYTRIVSHRERPDVSPENIKSWFDAVVAPSIHRDAFEELYDEARNWAYNFPGDDAWYRYSHPGPATRIPRGQILTELRGANSAVTQSYFSDYLVSREPILAAATSQWDTIQGLAARYTILLMVDVYFRAKADVRWFDLVTVSNDCIESADAKLQSNHFPLLYQVFGFYWAYDDATVFPADDPYEVLAIWMDLLRSRYNSKLLKVRLRKLLPRHQG